MSLIQDMNSLRCYLHASSVSHALEALLIRSALPERDPRAVFYHHQKFWYYLEPVLETCIGHSSLTHGIHVFQFN